MADGSITLIMGHNATRTINNNDDNTQSTDLSVTKTLSTTGPFTSEQDVFYTIVVSKAGPDNASNVKVEDLSTNLTNLEITSATSCPTGIVTAGVICTIANFAVVASETITIMATAP